MMKHSFKRLLSVFLAALMLFAVLAPASAAAEEEYPIVYVGGMGADIFDKDGNEVSTHIPDKDYLFNAVKDVLLQVPIDRSEENWKKYCDTLYNYFAPVYEDIKLDKNGEASDGSYVPFNSDWAYPKSSNFRAEDYHFAYDWRLDPYENAKTLSAYIDTVLRVTGKSKVTLLGRCMGACIVAAYLQMTENVEQKVKNVILYSSSLGGVDVLGACFSGQIVVEPETLDNFINYYMDFNPVFEDRTLQDLVVSIVSLAKYLKVLGFGTFVVQDTYDIIYKDIVPRLALASYASFPSYWSMVGAEYYEKARELIFKGREEEYAGLIEKTDRFYNNITSRLPQFIDELTDKGIMISYIAKYNFYQFPIFEGCDEQSDNTTALRVLSGGATSAKYGDVLSDEYIENAKKNGTDKYISADKIIDASTCRFPDRTWFFKNLDHATMPDSVNPLIEKISKGNGSFTVWSDSQYPQYMTYDKETDTFAPGVTEGDNFASAPKDFISAILRFFTNLFRYLKIAFEKTLKK